MPPKGVVQFNGTIKVAVCFPPALFRRLVERSVREGRIFSYTVCDAAECGLLDIEDLEASEEAA